MNDYLPKVLIFAYDFPPCNSVGSQRPYSWYKYFKTLGLYPVIITKNWDSNIQSQVDYIHNGSKDQTIKIETEYGTLIKINNKISFRDKLFIKYDYFPLNYFRKILSFLIEVLKYPFEYFDDNSKFYSEAMNYSKENKIDIIIASGEPFVLFKYAYKLSRSLKINWIADYRDGWTTDRTRNNAHFYKLLKFYYSYFENKYLKTTLFCSFATKDLLLNHSKKFPYLKKFLLYNGFFSDNKILQKKKRQETHSVLVILVKYYFSSQ